MKELKLFIIGALGYGFAEIIWRGKTHWTMLITGGLCFMIIYKIYSCSVFSSLFLKCIAGCLMISMVELTVGIMVNLILKMNVWDYSSMPFNFMGQICLAYSLIWFLICFPLNSLCEFLDEFIF